MTATPLKEIENQVCNEAQGMASHKLLAIGQGKQFNNQQFNNQQ